jgi:hypothetical protein
VVYKKLTLRRRARPIKARATSAPGKSNDCNCRECIVVLRLLQPSRLEDVQHLRARHRLRHDLPNGVVEVCFRSLLIRSHFVQYRPNCLKEADIVANVLDLQQEKGTITPVPSYFAICQNSPGLLNLRT